MQTKSMENLISTDIDLIMFISLQPKMDKNKDFSMFFFF